MNRLLLLFTLGCLAAQADAFDNVKLHGTIKHPAADSIFISYDAGNYVHYEQKIVGAKINGDGTFTMAFKIIGKVAKLDIQLGDQTSELLVQPGYDLELKADGGKFEKSLVYTGKGAETANFVARHEMNRGNMLNISMKIRELAMKNPLEFERGMNEELIKERKYLADSGKSLPKDIVNYWSQHYQYAFQDNMLDYPFFHEMMKRKTTVIKDIPQADYAFIEHMPYRFNDALLDITSYRIYVDKVMYEKLLATGYKKPEGDSEGYKMDDTLSKIAAAKMPNRTLEYYIAHSLSMSATRQPLDRSEKQFNSFKEHWPHSMYMPTLQHELAIAKRLSPGQPAMDFDITQPDGKKMKLSDLKGKVVYLDFWASWCGPCMSEMPFAKEIKEHYKDKDVAFVYVSIDEDTASWRKAIEKKEIKGIHTRIEGGWQSPLAELYGVQGVPSYFLIDKDGKFVTLSTPRPSDKDKLEAAIDKLLH